MSSNEALGTDFDRASRNTFLELILNRLLPQGIKAVPNTAVVHTRVAEI